MIYKCEHCDEVMIYDYYELFEDLKFCSTDCIDEYIKEHTSLIDISRE